MAVAPRGAYISDIIISSYIHIGSISLFVALAEQIASNTDDRGWILSCLYKNKGFAPSMEVIWDDYMKVYTPLQATALILVDCS